MRTVPTRVGPPLLCLHARPDASRTVCVFLASVICVLCVFCCVLRLSFWRVDRVALEPVMVSVCEVRVGDRNRGASVHMFFKAGASASPKVTLKP